MNGFQCTRNDIAVCVVESIRRIVLVAVEEPGIDLIFTCFRSFHCSTHVRDREVCQLDTAPERITADCFDLITDGCIRDAGAAVEDTFAECLDSTRHGDDSESGTAVEGIVADCRECLRERNAFPCQACAAGEAVIADAFDCGRNGKAAEPGAAFKG